MKYLLTFLLLFNFAFAQIKTNYVIKDISMLNEGMYLKAKQYSTKHSRTNVSGTKIILKCEGEIPEIFKDDTIYTYAEIHKELAKEEWIGYDGGLKIVGKFFITDYRYKDKLIIKINDCIFIQPIEINDDHWIIPYALYLRYKTEIDNNIDLYKCAIRNLYEYQFINQNL